MKQKIENLYVNHYKKLIIVPLLLLIFSFAVLGINYARNGEIIGRDVELKGGVEITIDTPNIDLDAVRNLLEENYDDFTVRELTDFSTRESLGITIKIGDLTEDDVEGLKELLSGSVKFTDEQFTASVVQAEFGEGFYKSLIIVLIFAFILMAATVAIVFRSFIPSIAVISAAFIDIIFALAVISLFGVKISGAGIVALLLVIGYSIDTDVLLTTNMLKRKGEGTLISRMFRSLNTGLLMTATTLTALIVGIVLSISPVLVQMFSIIFIALIADVISTYLGNAPILIWYCKKKGIEWNLRAY